MEGQSTPVSKHFVLPEGEVELYLTRKKFEFKPGGQNKQGIRQVNVKYCPFCPPHGNKLDNLWKLYFSAESGGSFCHRCQWKGSWFDFKKAIGDNNAEILLANGIPYQHKPKVAVLPDQGVVTAYPTALQWFPGVIDYLLNTRKLGHEVIRKYRVGASLYAFQQEDGSWQDQECVTFPWIEYRKDQETVVRVKARSLAEKGNMRLDPTGGGWGWFGWHTVPNDAREIVITEGEFDAMAVNEKTGMPTISLPNGYRSLPPELVPYLDRFERIILWFDSDVQGQESIEKFSEKLGRKRCSVVRSPNDPEKGFKDANDALIKGLDLKRILFNAEPLPHSQIITAKELRDEVYRELASADEIVGTPMDSLPGLTKIMKGHRGGELTLLTGRSGQGKTTVLSQISMDLANRGVHTLWGSFEIKNKRLVKKMLLQFCQRNLEKDLGSFNYWYDRYEELPMWYMRFFGSTGIDQILDAMEYADYQFDVKHTILDNLQFMTDDNSNNKFNAMDEVISKIRKFATQKNHHITLVIHPRKVGQGSGEEMDTSDLGGTAKAEQEADTIIILQSGGEKKYLDVKKNRFDGDLGKVYFEYQKATNRIVEVNPEENQEQAPSNTFQKRAQGRTWGRR